jgi:hypothetical protein
MPFGGGSAFNGGTITGQLVVAPTTDPSGYITILGPSGSPSGRLLDIVPFAGVADVYVSATGGVVINSPNNDTALGVSGDTSGASEVARFQDSGGTRRVRILNAGYLCWDAHSAPADGSLVAGDCAVWFDQTNGAAKFMVKAKQADGTVRTGQLALV